MKNQNGITLIALVITIIVLLILAGISIAMLTGENGILTQASRSAANTKVAEAKELATTEVAAQYAKFLENKYASPTNPQTFIATAKTETDKYSIIAGQTSGGSITITPTGKSAANADITVAGTIDENGTITWSPDI